MFQTLGSVAAVLFGFSFYYPLFMAYLWMVGGLFFYFHRERRFARGHDHPPALRKYPRMSILVPCYNGEECIAETIEHLMRVEYPDFEVIAIDDGSADRTGAILDTLAERHPKLRVVHLAGNQGKAVALRMGSLMAASEYLVCVDADALLDPHALDWIMLQFQSGNRVGAVTGNPRIRTRSTLLGRLQVGEFSSVVGLIKRAQRTYGRVFTVSGVVAAFRRTALHDVGYWTPDMLTEDVDVSWKLQLKHWDVRFEPNALCWILMPETLGGLWRQRLRWAMGGVQVMLKKKRMLRVWRQRRMWPVLAEFVVSVAWAYSMAAVVLLWLAGQVVDLPPEIRVPTLLPQWMGVLIATTCLLQIGVSLFLDSRYDKGLPKYYFWMIWYPIAYWIVNVATTVVALPRVLLRSSGQRARWRSPDRGVRAERALIIDRPDALPRARRMAWHAVTVVFWGLYLYLWLPLVSLVAWVFGIGIAYQEMVVAEGYREVLRLLGWYLVTIEVLCGSLVLWAAYNYLRFGGRERRGRRPDVSLAVIARHFHVRLVELVAWQKARHLRIELTPAGAIAHIETGSAAEAMDRQAMAN